MYSTCLFCTQSLGANEVLEVFPIGRRLAFDAPKGRLWVVCRHCERWNLSPLDERWEAIEAAERLFADTRTRVSTENIGMARLRGGLELVRIGRPLRPEFAAWRYGDQFGRRRKRAILYGAAGAALISGVVAGNAALGGAPFLLQLGFAAWNARSILTITGSDGEPLRVRRDHVFAAHITTADSPGEWTLTLGRRGLFMGVNQRRVFTGEEARRVTGLIMPHINYRGGRQSAVRHAVDLIETVGGPEPYLHQISSEREQLGVVEQVFVDWSSTQAESKRGPVTLGKLPAPTRLALEMSLHEEQERRALEGELASLEAAWKNAEEIAAIADDLLVSDSARAFIKRHRSSDEQRDAHGS